MRILYFSRFYTVHDYRFLEALGKSKHETYFLYLENGGIAQDQRSIPLGIKPLDWITRNHWQNWPEDVTPAITEFAELFARVRPDVVHAGPVPSCAYIAAMAKAHPLLAASWGSDLLVDADRTQESHDRVCFTLDRAEMLLADCHEVAHKAQALTGYPASRIVQFPWGVDLDTFKPGSDDSCLRGQFGADSFILLSTRNWEKNYGIQSLLEGFLAAHKAIPRLRLFLLGDGSLRSQIEAFIQENQLEDLIRMPGQVSPSNLGDYYRAADLYVSCTFSDGSSISLLEAMASGLPVIATDRASNREWVEEGSGGLLVKFGDSVSIGDAILRIASMSQEGRRNWEHRNLAIARERADWKKNFQKLLAAYENLKAHNSRGLA
jgi:glycosyltransferase involved in cell wall biosynthesis